MEECSKIFQMLQVRPRLWIEHAHLALLVDLPRVLGPHEEDLQMAKSEDVLLSNQAGDYESAPFYDHQSLLDYMDQKIRSRCGGLLEYINTSKNLTFVTYIHRTVRDYIQNPAVWHDFLKTTAESSFDPSLALALSNTLSFKRSAYVRRYLPDYYFPYWFYASDFAKGMNPSNADSHILLLDEYDRIATSLRPSYPLHWSNREYPKSWATDFLFRGHKSKH